MVDSLEVLNDVDGFEVDIVWYDKDGNDVTGEVMEDGNAVDDSSSTE